MSDDPYIRVSYGEFQLVPATNGRSIPRRFISRFTEIFTKLSILVTRGILACSVLAILFLTIQEVTRGTVIIEQLSVPETFAERGYSGAVLAHRLWDSTQWISETAHTSKGRASLIADSRQLEITEPGTGISLSGLVQMARRLLNHEQPIISGEIVCLDTDCTPDALELRLRAFHGGKMKISDVVRLDGKTDATNIDSYIDRAALELLALTSPYIRASFLYEVEEGLISSEATERARKLVASLDPLPSGTSEPRSAVEAKSLLRQEHPERAWAALLLSIREADQGNSEKALEWARKSASLMEEDHGASFPNAYVAWGNSLRQTGSHRAAIDKYQEALEIDPNYATAHQNWGISLAAQGQHSKAIEQYRAALEINQNYADAYSRWGDSLAALEHHEDAIEKYRVASEIDPENTGVYYNNWAISLGKIGRHEEAIEKYKDALEIDPENASAYYHNWGYRLTALERHEEAIEKYRAALEIDPNNAAAYKDWGNSLAALEHHEDAIEKYSAAFEIDPENVGVYYNNWAISLGKIGRHEEAIEKYKAALEIDPKNASAYHYNWGNSLKALGRHEEAIMKYEVAFEIEPNNATFLNNWGASLNALRRYEEAIEKYRIALKIDPANAGVYHNNWAISLGELGRHEEAIDKYRTAIKIDPGNASAYYSNLGNRLIALGRYEEALERYRTALEIDPNNASTYNYWGISLVALKRYEEATKKFRAALEIDPNNFAAYQNWMHTVNRLVDSAGSNRCAQFASAFRPLEQQASNAAWASSLLNYFDETIADCAPPRVTERLK